MARRPPWRRIRTAALLLVVLAAFTVLLHGCPSFRDGMSGELYRAQQACESATQTGVLAVDLWRAGKSTTQLAAVQLADARDEVTKNYKGIAELTATHDEDLRQQRALLAAMTDALAALNTAAGVIHGVDSQTSPDAARQHLTDAVQRLTAVSGR
jgi:type VI protein secretion system component VasF